MTSLVTREDIGLLHRVVVSGPATLARPNELAGGRGERQYHAEEIGRRPRQSDSDPRSELAASRTKRLDASQGVSASPAARMTRRLRTARCQTGIASWGNRTGGVVVWTPDVP